MEFGEEGDDEDVMQMATRLIRVLDYQQVMLSLKRRYVLERWPENMKKQKMLGLPTEGCVPESFIRDEKEFADIERLVETGIATLCARGALIGCRFIVDQSLEPPISRVQEMSDLEAIKHVPAILCSLNKSALKTLFYAIKGKPSTTNHRYILEREIKKDLAKLKLPTGEDGLSELTPGGLYELIMKMASIVRSPSSYRHTLGSANPVVNFVPTMPSCILAAAHKAFACVGNFPTRIVAEVGKLLIMESNTTSPLSFNYKTHSKTVGVVNQEVERVLSQLREDDPLPACLEGALHVISLSARILFGDDGGLARLLKSLPAEKLALEKAFWAAYNQVENVDDVCIIRVCDTLGKGVAWPTFKKQQRLDELRRLLINSMHCIYAFDSFPAHVMEAIQMINNTTDKARMECNNGDVEFQATDHIPRLSKKAKRVEAEIEAALNVSAAFQSVVWECFDSFYGHRLGTAGEKSSSTTSNDTEPSSMEVDAPHAMKIEIKTLENEGPDVAAADRMPLRRVQQDTEHYFRDVESFSNEAAAIVYVTIGCLLRDTAMQHSFLMDPTKVGYLQTGFDKLQHFGGLASNPLGGNAYSGGSENLNADEQVLCIAKQLKAIPKSVISEVERRIGQQ